MEVANKPVRDRQAGRQADRQTETDRDRDRGAETETETDLLVYLLFPVFR